MKENRILIIGSSGLVGTALTSALRAEGVDVVCFDLRAQGEEQGDICDRERVRNAVLNIDGIVHLAAVSRVLWGERDPDLCWATNVDGLRNVLDSATQSVCIRVAAPRNFDVARFVGDFSRAKTLLGWEPQVSLEEGFARLIQGFRDVHPASHVREVAR